MDLGVRDTLRWARWALEDVVVEIKYYRRSDVFYIR